MTNAEKFVEVFGTDLKRQYATKSWWDQEFVPPKTGRCDTCKHNAESWESDACDGCCGANSKWSGESYPGEFEAMEHNGRMDALESEEQA
jgi:hypothetical protein